MPSSYDGTKVIETLGGPRRYSELLPDLASGLERVMKRLATADPEHLRFSYEAILALHGEAFDGIVAWAGQPRSVDVQIRAHQPPPVHQVRELLKQFADNLEYRVEQALATEPDQDELSDLFAYSEGMFAHIHPFEDFNGRVSRLLLWILVLRLGIPHSIRLAVHEGDEEELEEWREALASFDVRDRGPLMALWTRRLEEALGGSQ